jgi:hypothetical protein
MTGPFISSLDSLGLFFGLVVGIFGMSVAIETSFLLRDAIKASLPLS